MSRNRKRVSLLLGLVLLISSLSSGGVWAGPAGDPDKPMFEAVAGDMELVLLTGNGRIYVEDPNVVAGTQKVTFNPPEAGWQKVVGGDFNGDGDHELVAIGRNLLKVYDPVVRGGTAASLDRNITPYQWEMVAAGDIDKDGRDEIMATRTIAGNKWQLVVFDGNTAGTQWTQILTIDYNYPWRDMAVGDFVGDERVELALIRDYGNLVHILNPQTGAVIVSESFGREWVGLAAGDFNNDGKDEIAVIRNVLATVGAGFVILRVQGVGLPLEAIYSEGFGSFWLKVSSGNLDGATNDEVLLLRNIPSPYKGLIARDLRTPTVDLNQVVGTGWEDIVTGDLNGDGSAEIIMQQAGQVRAYYASPFSAYRTFTGSWRAGLTTADLDGSGIVSTPTMQVSPNSLKFEMQYQGANPAAQKLQVRNSTSTSSFNWTATPRQSWVQVSPSSGSANANWTDINVSVNGAGLPVGTHTTRIVVRTNTAGVANNIARIPVSVTVKRPDLLVSPTSFNVNVPVGGSAPNQQIIVGQSGGGAGGVNWVAAVIPAVAWQQVLAQMESAPLTEVAVSEEGVQTDLDGLIGAHEAVEWLSVTPESGTTPGLVVATFHTAALEPGTYIATIIFDSGRGATDRFKWVDVTLTVQGPISAWKYLPLAFRSAT
ncbi:MAG: VCBS repeat-containing protein [Chloroflexi bacterium]|nr:VCBS repeat-containing protein [Chloroflexota bacterium]